MAVFEMENKGQKIQTVPLPVTPKIVQVPGVGNVQFPGDMPDDQVSAAIQKNFPQLATPPAPGTPGAGFYVSPSLRGTYQPQTMSAGTTTFEQTHPIYQKNYGTPPGAAKRFAGGAGIPTSQAETTDAVQGLLTPQADPAEQDKLLRFEEQIPLLGGDFRARADLAKRGDTANAAIPLFGPANAAFGEKVQKGDYAGAAGSALNALLSLEGLKGAVKPKPTAPEGMRSPSEPAVNQPALPPKTPGTYTGPPVEGTPGVVAKGSAAATSKVLGGGPEAMQKAPIKQQTAAGVATNAEVRNYAASKGIDLLPGQATGSRGLQTLQAVGERSIVAPGDLPEVLEKQKAAFGNAVDDFKTRVGTEAIPDTEHAGLSLQSQAHNGLDTLKKSAQADYQAFQDATGDIPVNLDDVKAKYGQKLADQAEALKNVPAQYANPVRNVLKKLSGIEAGGDVDPRAMADFNQAVESYGLNPEQQAALRTKMGLPAEGGTAGVKMSTAQQLRSAYLDIARDYSGNVPKSVQRLAGEAAKDIDAAMAKSADQAGATDQWRQANAKWKQLQQTYNNPEHPLYKILQEPDSVKVPSKLLGKGSYGGSPNTIRQLQEAGIDVSPLKREVAQQIADRNFALTNGGRGLAGYSTEFLKTLYTPEEFAELTTMGRVGRAIKFEMNPSGTSNVMEGRHQLMGIIHGTVGATVGPIASRITTSKALARAAMGDISAAQPHGLLDILGNRGPEPPPELPPSGGTPVTPNQGPSTPSSPKSSPMAAATEERGIKPPQKRTFERVDEKGVKDFFSYRFDQLRGELKAAQEAGDQGAIADAQRRMDELDQIQRQPRSLQDVLSGKPPAQTPQFAYRTRNAGETGIMPRGRHQASLDPAKVQSYMEGRGAAENHPQELVKVDLSKLDPSEYTIEPNGYVKFSAAVPESFIEKVQGAQPKKLAQPQSVHSAIHEVLGENPAPEHKPTTPQQEMQTGATVQGNYGNDTAVKTTTGSLPAKYKVVEADSLIPSHNAQTFAKNPQYPEGVQERAYHTSKEAQNRVIQQAQNYDPAYTINTNPDAVNGPPVVTKDGIVLGGNSRTMSTQRLYKSGGGDSYRADLAKNAAQFGVSPEQIAGMKQPVLVRKVETPQNIEEARRIGADLNRNMTGAMGTGEKAVSAGRSVKPQTLATISGMVNDMGEGATLRDAMRQHGKDFVSMMVKDGVISERERPQFIDTSTGGLNEEGKTFVERALVGSVVDDPRLMDRVPKSVLGKLEGSLGDLAAVGARTDEYNLLPLVREALAEHAEMAMRGLDVNKFLAQSNMFGQSGNPAVEAMTRALADKPKAFREALRQYAQDAKYDAQGQGLLGIIGNKPSAVKAFNDAFGTTLTEEQFHDALLQSYKKEGTIGVNAGQETGNPKAGGNLRENPSPQTRSGSKGRAPKAGAGQQAADEQSPVAQRSLADILGGKPQEKIDLNAPKSKRVIPPDVTAKADRTGLKSGQAVPDQTTTKPFRDWFGESKVVDESGKPLVVYHGTNRDVAAFDKKLAGKASPHDPGLIGPAFYFTNDADQAGQFAQSAQFRDVQSGKAKTEQGANVVPAYLSMKNPLRINDGVLPDGKRLSDIYPRGIEAAIGKKLQSDIKKAGHDGVILSVGGHDAQYVVFDPKQIKSATGNKGTFNPNDPKIINKLEPADLPSKNQGPRSLSQILAGANA